MKILLNLFIIYFFTLTTYAKTSNIQVTGLVKNHKGLTLTVTDFDNKNLSTAKIDELGKFEMKIQIENGYYLLNYGRESSYIYLNKGDQLNITLDALHFKSTLNFEGVGAERNNYLIKKAINDALLTKDITAFYKVNEASFINNIEKVKSTHLKSLANFNVEKFFIVDEKKSLDYGKLLSIQNYTSSYKFYLGEEVKPSSGFYKPLETLNLNNDEDYLKLHMYRYLVNSIWSDRISEAKDVEAMLNVLRNVNSNPILISLVNGFYSKISSEKERGKDYFELIKLVAGNNKGFVEAARKKLKATEDAMGLVAGNKSPSFDYISIEGKQVLLDDFKGKYIYIDIWATWCGPCIKQIPYLKKLEDLYDGENIVFVSISVDKDSAKDKWREMVNVKELGGIQLFADKSFDSDFMKAYGVNSIPRFIIIDPEGNILNSEAPRPSYEKTKMLLDSFLK